MEWNRLGTKWNETVQMNLGDVVVEEQKEATTQNSPDSLGVRRIEISARDNTIQAYHIESIHPVQSSYPRPYVSIVVVRETTWTAWLA